MPKAKLNHIERVERDAQIRYDYQQFKWNKHKGQLTELYKKYNISKQRFLQIAMGIDQPVRYDQKAFQFVEFDPSKLEKKPLWEHLKKTGDWPTNKA